MHTQTYCKEGDSGGPRRSGSENTELFIHSSSLSLSDYTPPSPLFTHICRNPQFTLFDHRHFGTSLFDVLPSSPFPSLCVFCCSLSLSSQSHVAPSCSMSLCVLQPLLTFPSLPLHCFTLLPLSFLLSVTDPSPPHPGRGAIWCSAPLFQKWQAAMGWKHGVWNWWVGCCPVLWQSAYLPLITWLPPKHPSLEEL